MEIIHNALQLNEKHSIAILGNFDGLHKGHRQLINTGIKLANKEKCSSLVLSFYPHPSFIISHKEPVEMIYSREEKIYILEKMGLDFFVEYPFNEEVMRMDPLVFIEEVLINKINAKAIVVGENYHFGNKRSGDVKLLNSMSKIYNYNLNIISGIMEDEKLVSSTLIRKCIKNGDIVEANKMLVDPFMISGEVIFGKQLGSKIGFPTVNILVSENKLLPTNGVYITRTEIEGKLFNSITNIGVRPTVTGKGITVETHILNYNENIYGKKIKVYLLKRLRKESKFNSITELQEQIKTDIKTSMEYFNHM